MIYKKITSTELKQNTRKIIEEVREAGVPYIVSTYGEEKVALLELSKLKRLLSKKIHNSSKTNIATPKGRLGKISDLKKHYGKTNFAKLFRDQRDEE